MQRATLTVVTLTLVLLNYKLNTIEVSPDLLASWLAAEFYEAGNFAAIYPEDTALFTMRPPEIWATRAAEMGLQTELFAYLYPPLWVHLLAPVTSWTDYATFKAFMSVLNPLLLAAIVGLAWRAMGAQGRLGLIGPATLLILGLTLTGHVALAQNQPQILAAFFIVLAAERSTRSDSAQAGAALAVAAALKGYPAIFALIWLARKQKRALAGFLGVGAGLAGLSVACAGWPLHAEFIAQARIISQTHVLVPVNLAIEPMIAQWLTPETFAKVPALLVPPPDEIRGHMAQARPDGLFWSLLAPGLYIFACAAVWFSARRFPTQPLVWPFAVAIVALCSPLAWCYYYIPVFAYLGILMRDLRAASKLGVVLVSILPVSIACLWLPRFGLGLFGQGLLEPWQAIWTLSICATTLVLAMNLRQPPRTPLRRPDQGL